jgi:hypothetical protein
VELPGLPGAVKQESFACRRGRFKGLKATVFLPILSPVLANHFQGSKKPFLAGASGVYPVDFKVFSAEYIFTLRKTKTHTRHYAQSFLFLFSSLL